MIERTPQLFEKIERYLDGRMDAEELSDFENQMRSNEDLSIEVAKHKELHEALADQNTLEFARKVKSVMENESEGVAENPKLFRLNQGFRIAAGLFIILGLSAALWFFVFHTPAHERLYADFYEPFPLEDVTRGRGDDLRNALSTTYGKGLYEKSIPFLKETIGHTDDDRYKIYLGISYLETQQTALALEQFEQIGTKSPFYEQSLWYKALTYLKKKKVDQTKKILQEIIDARGLYASLASSLLERIPS